MAVRPADTGAGAAGPYLDLLVRRSLVLLAERSWPLDGLLEAAELVSLAGLDEESAAFRALAAIRMGVEAEEPVAVGAPTAVIARCVADMRASLPLIARSEADEPSEPAVASEGGTNDPGQVAAARCRELVEGLFGDGGPDAPDALLRTLAGEVAQPIDLPAVAGGPLAGFARAVLADALNGIIREWAPFAALPLGSPALLRAAARSSAAGLGPFWRNVPRVVRTVADVPALVAMAAEGGRPEAEDQLTVLLASRLGGDALLRLIDLLGDLGRLSALTLLFDAVLAKRAGAEARHALFRLRDAVLDLGAPDLAARIQHRIALASGNEAIEWIVLGEVEASAGRRKAAAEAFGRALAIAPGHAEAIRRLHAVRTRAFEPFRVTAGFGSSIEVRLRRAALRTGACARPLPQAPLE